MISSAVKVLVVDDDKAMRDACFQILSRMGFEIDLAADGRHALHLLGERIIQPRLSGSGDAGSERD